MKLLKELQRNLNLIFHRFEIIDESDENSTAKIAAKLAAKDKIKIIVKGSYSYRCIDERGFKKKV